MNKLSLRKQKGVIINISKTPYDRLLELVELYNSMEYKLYTNTNRLTINNYIDEINLIINNNPELINKFQLNFENPDRKYVKK